MYRLALGTPEVYPTQNAHGTISGGKNRPIYSRYSEAQMSPPQLITARIVQGHRVASGQNGNPLFPGGTLEMQTPLELLFPFVEGLAYGEEIRLEIPSAQMLIIAPDKH